jgi:DNA polymerase-4
VEEAPRKILHIDADCFYAAVEMRDDPSLRDHPIAVGGSADRRGVITTCNYPARAFGVRSAMPTSQALRLCPDLRLLPVQMSKYREVSQQMRAVFARYSDAIEPISLDEAYLDVSGCDLHEGSATRIAEAIRAAVAEELGITVSAGVSVNKFVAKVASDWQKPDGLTVVTPQDVDQFVADLPVAKIPGVGRVTEEKLLRHGFRRCEDLRAADVLTLTRLFGSFGVVLHERAFGRDERPVSPNRVRKSLSTETTFSQDLVGEEACLVALSGLLDDLQRRAHRAALPLEMQKPFVKIKFSDFSTTTVERSGAQAVPDDFRQLLCEGLHAARCPSGFWESVSVSPGLTVGSCRWRLMRL